MAGGIAVDEGESSLRHEAFFYRSADEYQAVLAPYVEDGVRGDDAVFVVVPSSRVELLRTVLSRTAASGTTFIDAVEWYRHPARAVAQYSDLLAGLGRQPARVVGEVQFGNSDDWAAWTRYETVLNRALSAYKARVVCPYALRGLPTEVITDAFRTHPLLFDGSTTASPTYVPPERLVPQLQREIELPDEPSVLDVDLAHNLRLARAAFVEVASTIGIDAERLAQLNLALNEIMTNAVIHGEGRGRLRVWLVDGSRLICAVDDDGPGPSDPLVGFIPPPVDALGERGLWLARQWFDRVEVSTTRPGHRVTLITGRS
jgi:anti-sigma regulatory factor (Ser/Thr protein kinase)